MRFQLGNSIGNTYCSEFPQVCLALNFISSLQYVNSLTGDFTNQISTFNQSNFDIITHIEYSILSPWYFHIYFHNTNSIPCIMNSLFKNGYPHDI